MALGNPYKLESEVITIFIQWDADSWQHAYGIIELDDRESKNGNQHSLYCNLVNHSCSEELEAQEDGDLQNFQTPYGFLSKHFKMPDKTKGEPWLSEQSLFVDVKQPSYSKMFVSSTIEDRTRIESYNDNEICAAVVKSIVPENRLRSDQESESLPNVS